MTRRTRDDAPKRPALPGVALYMAGLLAFTAGWLGFLRADRPGDRLRATLQGLSGLCLMVATFALFGPV